jgi:LCP family protein required for cell wall assembly
MDILGLWVINMKHLLMLQLRLLLINKVDVKTTKTDVTEEPFVLYVTGVDTEDDISTVSRNDVNLVLVVNPVKKQILMVSIPRDIQVSLASNGEMDKLTHTGQYGIDETLNTLEYFLSSEFDYYVKTNFTGIVDIIDELVGVIIDFPYEDFVTLHGDYTIRKGINEMGGEKALGFVRERYSLPLGVQVTGVGEKALTYSISHSYQDAIVPDADIVEEIQALLDKIESGKTIKQADIDAIAVEK